MEGRIQIKRLNEREDISDKDIQELSLQPEIANIADVDTQLPDEGDTSADPNDVSVLTVGDFLEKCREIDPLVCMGITAFIENNQEAFGESNANHDEEPRLDGAPSDADISFSKSIESDNGHSASGQLDLNFPKA